MDQSERKKKKDLSSEVLENTIFTDPVLETKLFPKLHPDLVPTLSDLQRNDLPRHLLLLLRLLSLSTPEKSCCWGRKLGFRESVKKKDG